jgi:translation initiation factor eIF-2B subunit epsilon
MYQSTLGADCSLGPNTVVHQSYIFDDVRIGANCTLNSCMIGRNVEIADNVKIGKGVLLGDGVKLGKGVNIPDFARIGRERWVPEYPDDEDLIEGEEEKGMFFIGGIEPG